MNINKHIGIFYQVILIISYGITIHTFCMDEEEDKLKKEYEKNKSLLSAYKHSIQSYPHHTYSRKDIFDVFAGYPDVDDHDLIPFLEEYFLIHQDEQKGEVQTISHEKITAQESEYLHV